MAVNINIPSQVSQTITDGVTDKAPSENAVNDALALKANSADLGATAFSNDYNDLDNLPTLPSGTVTSVGLTMPSAFSVANSPITSSGDIAVTGAGLTSQYVRGDGSLGNFPNNGGGGSSVNYYLNGSVSQGTFGGSAYYELSKTPVIGAGTNFTRTNAQGNGYIASFITDAGDPNLLNIPGGNWNLEFYFNSSSSGGSPSFYAELYKVDLSNAFTLIASGATNPEGITNGTTVDQYFTSIPVPQTTILATDRIAIRIFVIPGGRNITLHTEDNNLSQIITTFSTGLNALNGLSAQVQYFGIGTSGTDFNINSATDTHTFNLPTASATNRGALSSADWSAFNGKQATLVSGTNIKTINGTSILGSGDITVGGGITVGTTAVTSGTVGRVFFQGTGNVVQQDAALFWDNTNSRLGVGATPSASVRLDVRAQGALSTDIAFRVRNSADSVTLQQFNGDGSWLHRNNANTFYEYFDGTSRIEYRRVGSVELGTNNDVTQFRFVCNVGDIFIRGGTNLLSIVNNNNFHFEESTGLLPTSGAGCIVMKNRTAPSTNVADRFYLYSADITAGNAAPHFRTENGNIIKLYQQSSAGITTVAQLVTVLQNLGLLS